MIALEFFDAPGPFLAEADRHLGADPVLGTVVATVTERRRVEAEEAGAGGATADDGQRLPFAPWWVVARQDGEVVGVGMRTAPFEPYPVFLLPMPEEAAVQVAETLAARGEVRAGGRYGVNGALPAARQCAARIARLIGGRVREGMHTRLFEFRPGPSQPSQQADAAGGRRLATIEDLPLVSAWFADFSTAADEQAGRPPGSGHEPHETEGQLRRRLQAGTVWLWQDESGAVVHLSAHTPPSFGVVRIGPVYTPAEHRGQGYASAMVGALSREFADGGVRVCLFTDQANPTSNAIYQRIGYQPVVDMVNLVIGPDQVITRDGGELVGENSP